MATFDRYGLPLSTTSPAAADAYVRSVDASLALNGGAQEAAEEAIAADEGFALAHVALARLHQLEGRMADAQAEKERALALAGGTTRREQQHLAVMARAIDGDGDGALALIHEHLQDFPRDAYLLNQAQGPFGLIGFGGRQDRHEQNFAILDGVKDAYGDDWWFLSAYAFAHNELYHFDEARTLAERALALYEGSGAGAHTLAHVHYETGDAESGRGFLDGWLPGYPRDALIRGHLAWHLALFELVRGNADRALAIYEEELRPEHHTGFALTVLTDAVALTWRQDLDGAPRPEGSREALHEFARTRFGRPGITFADCHCAMAYAAAGDFGALEALSSALKQRLAEGKLAAGPVVPALVDGIAAFARGEYAAAVALMDPVLPEVVRVGGSNAQREVFEDTLIEACLRAGRSERATELLRARLERRPSPRDQRRLARTTPVAK